jgi:glutamyl-tRNA reductase
MTVLLPQFCYDLSMAHATELGMVGTTFRRAGQAGLAYYTLPHEPGQDHSALHDACEVDESVYLATCNRVEFFFAPKPSVTVAQVRERFFAFFAANPKSDAPAPFDHARRLHAFAGEGAVERLFVVAAAKAASKAWRNRTWARFCALAWV